jgi:hypothetical protein
VSSGKLPPKAPSSGGLPVAGALPSSGKLPAADKAPSSGRLPAAKPASEDTPAGDALAEVERALSILDGRHPEALRAEREDQQAKAVRKALLEHEAILEKEAARRKRLMIAVVAASALAIAAMLVRYHARSKDLDAKLDAVSAAYTQLGFSVVASSTLRAPDRVEASVEPGCMIAVALGENPSLKVDHGTTTVRGQKSIAWCTCAPENVALSFSADPPKEGGLRILRAEGKIVGGSVGLRFLQPAPGVVAAGAEECGAEYFDGWIADKRHPPTNVDEKWLETDAGRKQLLAAGLRGVAGAPPEMPFAVVEPVAKHCFVAMSTAATDSLSLRVPGGDRPIANVKGAIAWCDARDARFVVEREGLGELFVLAAPSTLVGGMLGLRDILAQAGARVAAAWVRHDDLPEDAMDVMRSMGIGDPKLAIAGVDKKETVPNARIVALSQVEPGVIAVDTPPETFWECAPSLDDKPLQALCVQSRPQSWRTSGASPAGVAQATLPSWMSLLEPFNDPALVHAEHQLLVLARALKRQRFEPTTLEGVTEQPRGAEVLGRAGEDAVVAIVLAPVAPWAFPLTDGEPWKLGDAPRVVPLKPGDKIQLTATPPPVGAKDARRTVVFRRQAI